MHVCRKVKRTLGRLSRNSKRKVQEDGLGEVATYYLVSYIALLGP